MPAEVMMTSVVEGAAVKSALVPLDEAKFVMVRRFGLVVP